MNKIIFKYPWDRKPTRKETKWLNQKRKELRDGLEEIYSIEHDAIMEKYKKKGLKTVGIRSFMTNIQKGE